MHHHHNPPGHMRPRRVRRILQLSWLAVVAALAAALILAPKSHAVTICATLSLNPTVGGVETIALGLIGNGLTPYQAGQVIGSAVLVGCPEYIPVLREFGAKYAHQDTLA